MRLLMRRKVLSRTADPRWRRAVCWSRLNISARSSSMVYSKDVVEDEVLRMQPETAFLPSCLG